MSVSGLYFDSAYLAKLYLMEPDAGPVRTLAAKAPQIVSSGHGRAELAFILHRKYREGALDAPGVGARWKQIEADESTGLLRWLPNTPEQLDSAARSALRLPRDCFLRAADALHLVCARDHGFKTVCTNDKVMLAAARHFGLRARRVTEPR